MKNQIFVATNLSYLRSLNRLSQAEVAEKVNVSRQAVAKWESGISIPSLLKCEELANLFNVSLNDLVKFNPKSTGYPIGPKDKHIFGTVIIGERGQIVLPKRARDIFGLKPGDTLIVLGDTNPSTAGIALINSNSFLTMTGQTIDNLFNKGEK